MKSNLRVSLLRLLLAGAGAGWAISVIGVFLPWSVATEWLEQMGGSGPIPNDPMANYWLRMAAGAFTSVGVLFLLCAWQPRKFARVIPILAILSLAEGIVLLAYGLLLDLALFPFVADVAICIVPGVGVLLLRHALDRE